MPLGLCVYTNPPLQIKCSEMLLISTRVGWILMHGIKGKSLDVMATNRLWLWLEVLVRNVGKRKGMVGHKAHNRIELDLYRQSTGQRGSCIWYQQQREVR